MSQGTDTPTPIALTPVGWAALASIHLGEKFPDLKRLDPEVQEVLRPLFRKAVDSAIEHAYHGLLPPSTTLPNQTKANRT